MKINRLKLNYKQQGMTLIEVMIASVILFISISAISMVARTKMLNENKLNSSIKQAYLSEFLIDEIKYHLEYTDIRQGEMVIAQHRFIWHAAIEKSKPPMSNLPVAGAKIPSSAGLLNLYKISITEKDKSIFSTALLVWDK